MSFDVVLATNGPPVLRVRVDFTYSTETPPVLPPVIPPTGPTTTPPVRR